VQGIAGGAVSVGQKVVIAASGRGSEVTSLYTDSDPVQQAGAGRSVILTLAEGHDVFLAKPLFDRHACLFQCVDDFPAQQFVSELPLVATPGSSGTAS